MAKNRKDLGSVYSTEQGTMCPSCGNPISACNCKQNEAIPAGDGIVRISHETKGRKGKGVTVIHGIPLAQNELKLLAKKLKQKCGTGGTLKGRNIEIQGDHREILSKELCKQGFKIKQSGN